jgi:hypothetical protein
MDLRRDNKGITLVEVLVASILSVVVGYIIFTILGMFSNESGQSISSFMMNQQYDNVAQQIARDARRASFVFTDGETALLHGAGSDTVTSIIMCDAAGLALAQYKIVDGILVEGVHADAYEAGGNAVRVVPGSSYFVLGPQRKNVALHLSLCKTDRKTHRSISARKDVFICRN